MNIKRKDKRMNWFGIMGSIVLLVLLVVITWILFFKSCDDEEMYPGEIRALDINYERDDDIFIVDLDDVPDRVPEYQEHSNRYVLEQIPFDDEMQVWLQDICEEYGVKYSYMLAIIDSESDFREDIGNEKILGGVKGGARYYGYCQLSKEMCEEAKNHYGLDAHTPHGNIEMGVALCGYYYHEYEDYDMVTMCYKSGPEAAKSLQASGKKPGYLKGINSLTNYYDMILEEARNNSMLYIEE